MFANGDRWREQRRFTLFHIKNLGFGKKSNEFFIHEESEDLVREIKQLAGKPFRLQVGI